MQNKVLQGVFYSVPAEFKAWKGHGLEVQILNGIITHCGFDTFHFMPICCCRLHRCKDILHKLSSCSPQSGL